jgi:hypothetical protein
MAWDKDKPAGSQKIRLSDEEIRANWAALEDALGRQHTFPGVLGGTAGEHTPLIANLQNQLYTAAAAGGTVDVITAAFVPALAALTNNTLVCVIAAGANLTTAPTFAPDGLAAKTIVKKANQPMVAGDIPGAGYPMLLVYNSTYVAWVLLNPAFVWTDKVAVLQNRQAQNIGGGTATSGSWLIVPINVEYEDADGIVDSSSLPAFSLAAGTYRIEAQIQFRGTNKTQLRLYNVTDAAVQQNIDSQDMYGFSAYNIDSYGGIFVASLIGAFTIADTKALRLEYQVQTTHATYGFGYPANFAEEVYAQVKITQIA